MENRMLTKWKVLWVCSFSGLKKTEGALKSEYVMGMLVNTDGAFDYATPKIVWCRQKVVAEDTWMNEVDVDRYLTTEETKS